MILGDPWRGQIENSECVCRRLRPDRSNSTAGLRWALPTLPVEWPLSEARDRVQTRGRDRDGMLAPGQSMPWWSGVGRGVNALPRGSLGCQPSPPQLLIESIVCRGSCKRKLGLGEWGMDRPGGMCGMRPWRLFRAAELRREEGLAGVLAQGGARSQRTQEEPGAGT